MTMDSALSFFGILSTVLVALVGWHYVNKLAAERDVKNERLKLRTQYLLNAYRSISEAVNRGPLSEEQKLSFEAAISDIMLLGNVKQRAETKQAAKDFANQAEEPNWDLVLKLLRKDLRKELGMQPTEEDFLYFRFQRTKHCP